MAVASAPRRAPGPQSPNKYPRVGPAYQYYGEQAGYIYDPYGDRYVPDPKVANSYYESAGLKKPDPKQPGLGSTLGTAGAVVGVGALGTAGASRFVRGIAPTPTEEAADRIAQQTTNAATGSAGTSGGMLGKPPAAPSDSTAGFTTDSSIPTPKPIDAPPTTQSGGMLPSSAPTPKVIGPGESVPPGYTPVGSAENGGKLIAPNESIKPDGSVDLGAYAQGALGAYQLYQGYRDYKQGNYLGAGVNTAAGGAAIGSALGSESAAGASSVLGPVAGAYGAYQTVKGAGDMPSGGQRNSSSALSGAASGAAIGSAFGPIGTGVGAVAGAAIGLGLSLTGSSKDKYQMIRDKGRDVLVKQGVLRQDESGHQYGTLADGTEFDFSKDGKKYGKPDSSNPNYGEAAAFGDMLASSEGLVGRGREAMATMYANAAVSNAKDTNDVQANFAHFAQQRGLTYDAVVAQLEKLKAAKKDAITDNQYQVWKAKAAQLLPSATPPSQPGTVTGTSGVTMTTKPLITTTPPAPAPGSAPVSVMMPRTRTISPGIGLDGKRISY